MKSRPNLWDVGAWVAADREGVLMYVVYAEFSRSANQENFVAAAGVSHSLEAAEGRMEQIKPVCVRSWWEFVNVQGAGYVSGMGGGTGGGSVLGG